MGKIMDSPFNNILFPVSMLVAGVVFLVLGITMAAWKPDQEGRWLCLVLGILVAPIGFGALCRELRDK